VAEVEMFRMSWVEVKEWLATTDTVIIPTGSIEQHGPHLPISIDSRAAYYVAVEAGKEAQVPVAPLQPFGYSCFHMRKNEPGTITLSDSTYVNLMVEIGRSLIHHGFKKLIYTTGHTANTPALDRVIRQLKYKHGVLAFHYASDTEVYATMCGDVIDGHDQLPGWHGGEVETSGALLFASDVVHLDRAKKVLPNRTPWMNEDMNKDSGSGFYFTYKSYPVHYPFDQEEYSENGIMGNPGLASVEKGQEIYSRMIHLFAEFVSDIKKLPAPEVKNVEFDSRY
jgi:creatinine amidohydrolase